MNNNAAMINDVMGQDDDYGDYGDEGGKFAREEENAYDFMWWKELKSHGENHNFWQVDEGECFFGE